jgi:hypothetical protein
VQDYSQGFRAFINMGLPDTSKAKYVKLVSSGRGMRDPMMHRLYELPLSGNAWLVSENKEGKSILVSSLGGTLELVLIDQKAATKKPADETGKWTPADLSRDLAKAITFVDQKIKAKAAGGREMRYDSFLQSDESSGVLFLLAAFAWQNGRTQEANALAGRLFTLVGDSRKVIVGALNVMANAQLAVAADGFWKTGDWKAYHASVTALLKKFPAGWRQAGAVRLLAGHLQARSAMSEPPAVTGEGLGEEDRKLAAALASETHRASRRGWGGELWILPPSKAMGGIKDDSAIGRIKARGIKSVPLLIALISDETLCPLRRSDIGMPTYSSYSSRNEAQRSEAERAQAQYNQMDRPLTRGEIARGLLAPLCRREENAGFDESEVAPEEVLEGARKVYAELKALPPSGLAGHFLKNGDQRQKQAAIGAMLESDVEAHAPEIEAFLLAPPSDESGAMRMGMGNGLVQQYVQKRGEKAANFVEKYAAMAKATDLPAGMADNADYVKQMKKQAEREIKTLRAMVKKQDLSTIVAGLAEDGDGNEGTAAAYTALSHMPASQALPALLTAAVKSTNAATRARMLQMMPMLRYSGMQEAVAQEQISEDESEGMEAAMKTLADKNKLSIGAHAADWKILLADTRAVPGGRMFTGGAFEYSIADLAAGGIESLYGDASTMDPYSRRGAANLRPEVMMKVTRARAAARADGKPEDQLPKFPAADDVTAERRKAIETDVLKASPANLGAMLEKLTDSESLFLAEAAGENEAIMKAMAPLSRRIASVKTAPALPAAEAARLQKLSGTLITTNTIEEMREVCKRQLATGLAMAVTLSSGGLGKGLRLEATPVDDKALGQYGYASMLRNLGGGRKGMVMGVLTGGQNHGYGMWLVDVPAPAKATGTATGTVAAASTEDDDKLEDRSDSLENMFGSQQEQFETAAEAFCKPDEAISPGASLSFTGMMPPKDGDKKEDTDGADFMF